MPRHHPPHTKRQEPISNFNTITYFYIYIHLHKKTKAKQFILSKDNSKLQDSQHKSDYERERERERERTEIPWCCLRSGVALPRHVEGWGSYLKISLLPSPISQSPIWAKSISDLTIVELLWVFNVFVVTLLSHCHCWEVRT